MSILQKEMTHTPKLYGDVFLAPFVSKLGKSIAGECEQLLANRGKSAEVCVPQCWEHWQNSVFLLTNLLDGETSQGLAYV